MQVELTIEKTDVKLYKVNVEGDWDDLVNWVDETHGKWYIDRDEEENIASIMEIEGTNAQGAIEIALANYYTYYVDQFIADKDPDLLFTDNCHNHQDYQLETEECSVRDANGRSVSYV